MAVVALLAVASLMVVFATVAFDAALFEFVFKILPSMAVIALQSGMRVFQGKVGFSMIEPNAAP